MMPKKYAKFQIIQSFLIVIYMSDVSWSNKHPVAVRDKVAEKATFSIYDSNLGLAPQHAKGCKLDAIKESQKHPDRTEIWN